MYNAIFDNYILGELETLIPGSSAKKEKEREKFASLIIYLRQIMAGAVSMFDISNKPEGLDFRYLEIFRYCNGHVGIMKHERKIYFAVLAWLLIGDYAAMAVRNIPIFASNPILYGLAGILSLSNIIGTCIGFIGNLMLDFWLLIIPLSFG